MESEGTIRQLKLADEEYLQRSSKDDLIELNLWLREDLTRAFESYVVLLAKYRNVQKEKIDLQYEILMLK